MLQSGFNLNLKRRFAAGLLASLLPVGVSAAEPITIDADASAINFESTQMGVTIKGHFERWEASIRLDSDVPANSEARIVVHTDSIRTGHKDTDREVKKKDWLAVDAFPQAEFTADNVSADGNGGFIAEGTLRIRDQQETVAVPFTLSGDDTDRQVIDGSFTIQRAAFNVGGGAWGDFDVVANDVRIVFSLVSAP